VAHGQSVRPAAGADATPALTGVRAAHAKLWYAATLLAALGAASIAAGILALLLL
jgi:hypothetical protein